MTQVYGPRYGRKILSSSSTTTRILYLELSFASSFSDTFVLEDGSRKLLYPSTQRQSSALDASTSRRKLACLYETLIRVEKQGMKTLTLSLSEYQLKQDIRVEKVGKTAKRSVPLCRGLGSHCRMQSASMFGLFMTLHVVSALCSNFQ